MKGLWKHVFFIERCLAVLIAAHFSSVSDFKAKLKEKSGRDDDSSMVDDMMAR